MLEAYRSVQKICKTVMTKSKKEKNEIRQKIRIPAQLYDEIKQTRLVQRSVRLTQL